MIKLLRDKRSVENLKKINEGNVEIQKTLEKEVEFMEAALEKKTRLQAYEMRELEQKIKDTGCVNNGAELFTAIITLGISCAFDTPTESKLKVLREELKEEMFAMKSL